jgi:micrococcal nuclease
MEAPEYIYNATIERVVDGDTIDCLVNLGFNTITTVRFRIISSNADYFDTPETWRPKTEGEKKHGEEAKTRAKELLEGKEIVLKSVKKGKYRYLAEVFLDDGINYADQMISEGFQKRESYE